MCLIYDIAATVLAVAGWFMFWRQRREAKRILGIAHEWRKLALEQSEIETELMRLNGEWRRLAWLGAACLWAVALWQWWQRRKAAK